LRKTYALLATLAKRGFSALALALGQIQAMKIKYFQDTDTLYIEFRAVDVAETKDLDENTILDLDRSGNICGITIEHARDRTDIPKFSYEQIIA